MVGKEPKESDIAPHSSLANTLSHLIRSYGYLPYILTLSAMIFSYDYYFYIVQRLSDTYRLNLVALSMLHCIRCLQLLISLYEISRIVCLTCLIYVDMLVMVGDIYSNLNLKIEEQMNLRDFKRLTTICTWSYISNKNFAQFQEFGGLVSIFVGMTICAVTNFATVKAYDVLPLPIYLVFPIMSLTNLVLVNVTLPYAHIIYERTREFLKNCTFSAVRRGGIAGKYMRCKLRGMRPFVFYARFGSIKILKFTKEKRMEYFESVISITVTLLLSVPELTR